MASGCMRRSTSAVMPPTPGPYSTSTRAWLQLTGWSNWRMRKRELGTIEPSMRGWRRKLRAKSRVSPSGRCDVCWLLSTLATPLLPRRPTLYSKSLDCKASQRTPILGWRRGAARLSAAGTAGIEAEPAQLGHEAVAMLALNLDGAVLDRAAGPAQFL